jgi:outer membrane lipoprotein carrier protein
MRFALLSLLLVSAPLLGADTARTRMQAFSADLQAVRAEWTQSVTGANGEAGDEAHGTLALSAPRQFRWEVVAPYQQTLVADGQKVWVYDPDLLQVTVRDQGAAEAHSPLTVLTDLSQLDRDFTTSESGERDGLAWLKLVSRAPEPDFEYAELGFSASALERMIFKDLLGNVTDIRFADWRRNPDLPAGTFRFVPPEGVDVIGDPTPAAEVFPVEE